MRQKQACFVVTFHTTAEARATEKLCAAQNLPGRLIPAPRDVSADCGIAWRAPAELGEVLRAALEDARIEAAGCYEMML